MPRKLLPFVIVLGAALGALTGCGKPMTEYTSNEYKFSAKFPGTPKQEEKFQEGIRLKMFGVEARNGACMVGVIDMPVLAGAPDAQLQAGFDGAQEEMIKRSSGKLQSSRPLTLDGKYPGREFTASITTPAVGLLRARIYFVNTRMYEVMVMGTNSYANSSDSTTFLNSFKLIP